MQATNEPARRRSVNTLVVSFPRTNYMKKSVSYSGATLWNSLLCNIRESDSIIRQLINLSVFSTLLFFNIHRTNRALVYK